MAKTVFRTWVRFKGSTVEFRPQGRAARGTTYSLGSVSVPIEGLTEATVERALELVYPGQAAGDQ